MEDATRLVAKEILAQFMSNDSLSSSYDASFNELEHLAELHKQIELKKAHREALRGLNLGLFALKQGIHRAGNNPFTDWLVKEQHDTVHLVVEKQREALYNAVEVNHVHTLLGGTRQALLEQAELQKLQGVARLQDQVRAKLAGTRVMKQWEREKATLLAEQKELAKLDVVGDEIMQKRKEMLQRKYGEIATLLISIGEGVEKAEELRMKLAEFTKQRRDELHDYQPSDSDLRSDETRKDGRFGGENGRDGNSCSPMFDTIDWNLGIVSVDLRLDLPFKNPNDFPDILTRLSTINTGKYQLQGVAAHTTDKGSKQSLRKSYYERRNTAQQTVPKQVATGKNPSSEQPSSNATVAKKLKMSYSSEKSDREKFGNKNGNTDDGDQENQTCSKGSFVTPKPLSKKHSFDKLAANGQHKVSRKSPVLVAQRETSPGPGPKASSTIGKRTSPTPKGTGQNDDITMQENRNGSSAAKTGNGHNINRTPTNQSKGKKHPQPAINAHQQQLQHRVVHQEKKRIMQQKQPEQSKRTRSMKTPSTVVAGPSNPSKHVQNRPSIAGGGEGDSEQSVSMETEEPEDIQEVKSSPSNGSLDFGMQSSSGEFDMNLSCALQPDTDANEEVDDDLDFLSVKPGRITRSKGQKKKQSNGGKGNNSNGDASDVDIDSFDFAFGGTNSNESLEQQDDLF